MDASSAYYLDQTFGMTEMIGAVLIGLGALVALLPDIEVVADCRFGWELAPAEHPNGYIVPFPDGTMGIPKEAIDSVNRNKIGLKSPL